MVGVETHERERERKKEMESNADLFFFFIFPSIMALCIEVLNGSVMAEGLFEDS